MDASVTLAWEIGNVKMHHTFNGAVPIGRGWMVCNGDQVTEAAYDAIHGTGAYVSDGVANSPIVGKHLPNMVGKYAVGVSSTTQSGASAITTVGNANNQIDIRHNHQWYEANNFTAAANTWGSTGSATSGLPDNGIGSVSAVEHIRIDSASGGPVLGDSYTNNQLSATQSIQPHSIEMLYIIKVA